MASGNLCLNLTECVSWDEFSAYAAQLLREIHGQRVSVAEAVDVRLWQVSVQGHTIRLVYDDYPMMVSLESSDGDGDALLRQLNDALSAIAQVG